MANKGRPFPKGNKLGKGGARPGTGPKPGWFKELCEEEMAKNKAQGIRLIGEISRGEAKFKKVMHEAFKIVHVDVSPTADEIVKANEFLRDSSFGRPAQAIEHKGKIGVSIFDLIRQAEEERGLPSSFDQ